MEANAVLAHPHAKQFIQQDNKKKRNIADLVIEHLVNEGVDKIFGIPGGATVPFHISLERHPDIEFILARHEGGAAFMADCYARTSGKLGVCCATTGPGATNLMTGVAAAFMDSIPMLVITGMNPTDTWGRGDFQESTPYFGIDTTQMFSSICKSSEIITSEKTLQFRLRNAIATAMTGRLGPVHIAISRDLWGKTVTAEIWDRSQYIAHAPSPSDEDIMQVIKLLENARRPLIIYGSGTAPPAACDLAEVSELLQVPLVTTPRAKGKGLTAVPSSFLGNMGISATPVVDQLMNENQFDVVLTVGAGFGSYATNCWFNSIQPTRSMIQVNIDPNAIGRIYPADIGIVADGAQFAAKLLYTIRASKPKATNERMAWLKRYSQQEKWPLLSSLPHDNDSLLSPLEIIHAVDRAAGRQSIVMADSNSILLWATHHLPERPCRRFISVWGSASMGHVTAGAIGAKLANPGDDVIAMVGDGCFLMNGNEIATAVDLKLPIVWVVNTNHQLGMIHYELRATGQTRSATFRKHDIAGFARALGAFGIHHKPAQNLSNLIKESLHLDGPTVIQVDVDPKATPPMGLKKEGSRQWQEYISNL